MIVIGVTGGIGAGKSTVARMLAERGAAVVDADAVAREVVEPGRPAWSALVAAFGRDIVRADGRIDRRRLARLAFGGGRPAVERLNRATHPFILDAIRQRLQELAASGTEVAVLDAPLLLETGLDALCDQVWVVVADPDRQAERVAARSGLSAEEVRARAEAQMAPEERLRRARVVIDNRGGIEATRRQVDEAWARLREGGGAP